MKRLVASVVVCILFSGYLSAAFAEEAKKIEIYKKESIELEKHEKYILLKKDPMYAVGESLCVPGVGHLYANDSRSAIPFFVGDVLCIAAMLYKDNNNNYPYFRYGLAGYLILGLWSAYDSDIKVEKYNENLRNKLGIEISMYDSSPALKMSYSF